MSNRCWLIAFGFWLSLSTIGLGQENPLAGTVPQQSEATHQKTTDQPTAQSVKRQDTDSSEEAATSEIANIGNQLAGNEEKGRSGKFIKTWSDSGSQWIIAITGIFATIISGVAVYLVWQTLKETRNAIKEAAAATIAAQAAVSVAEKSANAQLRAYISVSSAAVVWEDGIPNIIVTATNFGQTPAYHATWSAVAGDGDNNNFQDFNVRGPNSRDTWAPGVEMTSSVALTEIEVADAAKAQRGEHPVYAWGRISYTTIFDMECWSEYRYLMNKTPQKQNQNYSMSPCPEGNRTERDQATDMAR